VENEIQYSMQFSKIEKYTILNGKKTEFLCLISLGRINTIINYIAAECGEW
jgi:hypothetical protein